MKIYANKLLFSLFLQKNLTGLPKTSKLYLIEKCLRSKQCFFPLYSPHTFQKLNINCRMSLAKRICYKVKLNIASVLKSKQRLGR